MNDPLEKVDDDDFNIEDLGEEDQQLLKELEDESELDDKKGVKRGRKDEIDENGKKKIKLENDEDYEEEEDEEEEDEEEEIELKYEVKKLYDFESLEEVEIFFKDYMNVYVYQELININKGLIASEDFNKFKIAIAGGEALNFYFKNKKILKSHDFDLRIVLDDITLTKNKLLSMDKDIYNNFENDIYYIRNWAFNSLIKGLTLSFNSKSNISVDFFIEKEFYNFKIKPWMMISLQEFPNSKEVPIKYLDEEKILFVSNKDIFASLYDDENFFQLIDAYISNLDSYHDIFYFPFKTTDLRFVDGNRKLRFTLKTEDVNFNTENSLEVLKYQFQLNKSGGGVEIGENSLIDLVCSSFKINKNIGDPDKIYDERKEIDPYTPNDYPNSLENRKHRIETYGDIEFYNVTNPEKFGKGRKGYFKTFPKIQPLSYDENSSTKYIYVYSLGSVLWDTVRMLNFTIDRLLSKFNQDVLKTTMNLTRAEKGMAILDTYGKRIEPVDRFKVKFTRYLKKYQAIIEAFNDPSSFMTCDGMKNFINHCQTEGEKCFNLNKETIIDVLIESNYYNENLRESLKDVPLNQLCSLVSSQIKDPNQYSPEAHPQ